MDTFETYHTPCLQDDDYGNMEPPTSTTPTSKECDYKGTNMGICNTPIFYGKSLSLFNVLKIDESKMIFKYDLIMGS
jgi:hypothetical protein